MTKHKEIDPHERVNEQPDESAEEIAEKARRAEKEENREKNTIASAVKTREETVSPKERVEKTPESPESQQDAADTPEKVRQEEHLGPHKAGQRRVRDEASMQGLPGFSGTIPGDDN